METNEIVFHDGYNDPDLAVGPDLLDFADDKQCSSIYSRMLGKMHSHGH